MRKFLLLLLWIVPACSFAGQFLGGELSYTIIHEGNTFTRYKITLKLYRNCLSMADLPNPVIRIINTVDITQNNYPLQYFEETLTDKTLTYLDRTSVYPCVINTPVDCYEMIVFTKEIDLPFSHEGYTIFYTSCCRDEGFTNIKPESWNVGNEMEGQVIVPGQSLTYFTKIPRQDSIPTNNTPVIIADSIITACLQREINYRFHFTDADGDSLSYSFGDAYGKTNAATTNFLPLSYRTGYAVTHPMAGSPVLTLDAITGVLSGVPDKKGFFILPLEIREYRNKKLINIHRKEVQVNVYDCDIQKPKDILNCNSNIAEIFHENSAANSYSWDFGVTALVNDTSNDHIPIYVYPSYGEYTVSVNVTNADGCTDTTSSMVKIFPPINVNFTWNKPLCNGDPLVLKDSSIASSGEITKWTWRNDNTRSLIGNTSTLNYTYNVPSTGIYPLGIRLTVESSLGCKDSVLKDVYVYPRAKAYAGPDTTIAFDEIYTMQASGGNMYKWEPAIGLSNATVADPVLTINHDQRYIVEVSNDGFCAGKDTVFIRYMKGPEIYVPDAFTPNNDGLNDVFKVYGVSVHIKALEIYNRLGNVVFSTTRLEQGWNGTINGILQEAGTYIWYIKASDKNGKSIVRKGTLLLIR